MAVPPLVPPTKPALIASANLVPSIVEPAAQLNSTMLSPAYTAAAGVASFNSIVTSAVGGAYMVRFNKPNKTKANNNLFIIIYLLFVL